MYVCVLYIHICGLRLLLSYGMLDMESRSASNKANTLPAVLFLGGASIKYFLVRISTIVFN